MKILVCGSRSITNAMAVWWYLSLYHELYTITEVISGMAVGPDMFAYDWAQYHKIKIDKHPVTKADWQTYGKRAGIMRNIAMLECKPDRVIAFYDGKSNGTAHTMREAKKRGIPLDIYTPHEFIST